MKLADVAIEAGVSPATVDRVLNGRGVVRPQTREQVLQAAVAVGYIAHPADGLGALSPLTFDIILPGGTNSFLDALEQEVQRAAAALSLVTVRPHRVDGFDAGALAGSLDRIEASDGVGVVALDHPHVRDAMRRLRGRGVPIATLVSDMAEIDSLGYVGIDNRASGRLAAQLLGRLVGRRPGKVVLFLGSRSYRGHEEREIGFRHVLEDDSSGLSILTVRDTRDNSDATYRETLHLLREHDDIVGLYNIADGNPGIARALEEVDAAGRIVFVAHELTAASRQLLTSGVLDVAIDQNPAQEARDLLRLLVDEARGKGRTAPGPIRITPFFRENLP